MLWVGLLTGTAIICCLIHAAHFGEDLSRVLRNSLLVGEVATLARKIEDTQEDFRDHFSLQGTSPSVSSNNWNARNLQAIMSQETDESDAADNDPVVASAADAANAFMASRKDEAAKSLNKANMSIRTVGSFESVMSRSPEFSQSQQLEMAELLDAWEESQTAEEKEVSWRYKRYTLADIALPHFRMLHVTGKENHNRRSAPIPPSASFHEEKVSLFASIWACE